VDKLLDQGKMFFRMAEDLSHNYGQVPGDWGKALEKTFGDLQSAFSGGFKDGDETLHKVMAFWEMPFDNWQRMVSSLSLTPGDALRNMPHDQVQESLHRFLSAPGLGYTREEQGQYQSLMRRGVAYQKALHDYMQFFSGLGMKSVERLRQKMQQLRGDDKAVTSARGLYDLWVGTCEEVYGEQVMTPEYAAIHGRLVNALMGVKQRMMVIVDESLGALNMPTRTELRTLQDRLQENRRENKALRIELEQLKEAVEALGGAPAASEAPASAPETAAAPKAPVRRKATAKKAAARKTAAKPADR
jgi:class III poly(R)-hydroxyalkanoic acid synthase PhaE subunit